MRDPLDAALDHQPDYPPGFRQCDLEPAVHRREARPVNHKVGPAAVDHSRRVWLPLVELQCWWVCLGFC
jgi:hypothetical protein